MKGCGGVSGEHGCDVDAGFVDEALLKECAGEDATAFKEDGVYSTCGEFLKGLREGFAGVDECPVAVRVREEAQVIWKRAVSAGGYDHAPRLLFSQWDGDVADGEGGIVDPCGPGSDQDCVDFGSEAVGIEVRGLAGDASGVSVLEGDFSVEGHRALPDDPRDAGGYAFEEGAIQPQGTGFVDTPDGFDA